MLPNRFLTQKQQARMERVVTATKKLLGEFGIEGVTLRDIAKAAKISEGTLYNRFGTRSVLIDAVVLATFEQNAKALAKRGSTGTPLQRLLFGGKVMVESILETPGFSRALLGTFFKVGGDRTIQQYMYEVVTKTWFPILEEMAAKKSLRPWVSLPLLCNDLCERQFSVSGKWAQGIVSDKELPVRLDFALLSSLLGASQGKQEQDIQGRLLTLTNQLVKTQLPSGTFDRRVKVAQETGR